MECKKCKKALPDGAPYCPWCGAAQVRKAPIQRRTKGTGSVVKRGKVWEARVTLGRKLVTGEDGKTRSVPVKRAKSGFATKAEAVEYLSVLRKGPTRTPRSLNYYYEAWRKSAGEKLSKSKQKAYEIAWERLRPIAYEAIGDLSIVDLQDAVDSATDSFYPARDMKSLLSHAYKLAVIDGEVQTNPTSYIVLPELEEGEQRPFDEDELKVFWKTWQAGELFVGYILLMIYTGMMPGELMKCRVEMIDWMGHQIIGCGLKTEKRKETPIAFPDFIEPVLSELCKHAKDEMLLPYDKTTFYDLYGELLPKLGVRKLPMYSCRHTTATALAVGKNIDIAIIREVMRHTKITTTQRYMHPDTSAAKNALEKLAPKGIPRRGDPVF